MGIHDRSRFVFIPVRICHAVLGNSSDTAKPTAIVPKLPPTICQVKKAAILLMYGTVLFFVLRRYYAQGNTGLPVPTVLAAPTYLYGIAAITADFAGGFPVVVAAGLTVAFIWQIQGQKTANQPVNPGSKPAAANAGSPSNPSGKNQSVPVTGNTYSPGTPIDPNTGKPYVRV